MGMSSKGSLSKFFNMVSKFKSKFELRFAQDLTSKGLDYTYEPDTFKFMQEHTYTPDFKLGGMYIETKGRFTSRDRSKHLMVKQQHPNVDIRFVFMNANNKLYKRSKTTYGMWCDKHGFKYNEGVIPEEWMGEVTKKSTTVKPRGRKPRK
jgi:hypothetical protein